MPITCLAGVHPGAIELFAHEPIRTISDLKGKRVGRDRRSARSGHLFLSSHGRPVRRARSPTRTSTGSLLERRTDWSCSPEGKVDAFLGVSADEPQELRARTDRPRDPQHHHGQTVVAVLLLHGRCGNREFVQNYPVATKRALRAILKAADLCAAGAGAGGATARRRRALRPDYDYALQTLAPSCPLRRHGASYDPEDTLRFYALRLHEAGMISSTPATRSSPRAPTGASSNELKRELKA